MPSAIYMIIEHPEKINIIHRREKQRHVKSKNATLSISFNTIYKKNEHSKITTPVLNVRNTWSQAHAVKHEQLAEKGMQQKSQFCLIFTLIDQASWNHKKRPSFNHKEKLNLLFQKIEMAIAAVVQPHHVSPKLLWTRQCALSKSLACLLACLLAHRRF